MGKRLKHFKVSLMVDFMILKYVFLHQHQLPASIFRSFMCKEQSQCNDATRVTIKRSDVNKAQFTITRGTVSIYYCRELLVSAGRIREYSNHRQILKFQVCHVLMRLIEAYNQNLEQRSA